MSWLLRALFMWGFGWGVASLILAWGLKMVPLLSSPLSETLEGVLGRPRGALVGPRGDQTLSLSTGVGLVALASSAQTVLKLNV